MCCIPTKYLHSQHSIPIRFEPCDFKEEVKDNSRCNSALEFICYNTTTDFFTRGWLDEWSDDDGDKIE